jgi:hypothetical protein
VWGWGRGLYSRYLDQCSRAEGIRRFHHVPTVYSTNICTKDHPYRSTIPDHPRSHCHECAVAFKALLPSLVPTRTCIP